MDAEGVERVVVAEHRLDLGDHEVAEHSGDQSDEHGGHGLDESGGRGDRHQSGDGAGDSAQHAGLAVANPFGTRPSERGGRGAKCVATKALVARLPAASALPALKPNQPTHSRQAPMKLSTRLCGGMGSLG